MPKIGYDNTVNKAEHSPLKAKDDKRKRLREAQERLKWEKETAKGYRKAGEKLVKSYEAGGEDEYPRSEFEANKAEDRGLIQLQRETVKEERKKLLSHASPKKFLLKRMERMDILKGKI